MKKAVTLVIFLAIFVVSLVFLVRNVSDYTAADKEVQESHQALDVAEKEAADAYAECISIPEAVAECNRIADAHTLESYQKYYGGT